MAYQVIGAEGLTGALSDPEGEEEVEDEEEGESAMTTGCFFLPLSFLPLYFLGVPRTEVAGR